MPAKFSAKEVKTRIEPSMKALKLELPGREAVFEMLGLEMWRAICHDPGVGNPDGERPPIEENEMSFVT